MCGLGMRYRNNVGYMASATPGTAMILSVIIGFISPKTGNYVLLIIGTLCYTIIPLVLIIPTEEQLEATGYKIVMFYAVQGVSRVVFETANKVSESVSVCNFRNIRYHQGDKVIPCGEGYRGAIDVRGCRGVLGVMQRMFGEV